MSEVKVRLTIDGKDFNLGVTDAQKKLSELGKSGAVSAGQTAAAYRQLPAQLTDVATQLAGGANPMLVLLQQGGQVKDSFGGLVPAVRALSTVFTPLRLAVGGVGAALGVVALAAYQGRSEAAELTRSLTLTGNAAGMTSAKYAGMVRSIAAGSQVSVGAARELLAANVASGTFGVRSIDSVTSAMARLQRISGASTDEVVADFAGMSKGVAAWAAERNRTYGFLTLEQYRYIKSLEQSGQAEAAMVATAGALDKALADREPKLGTLQRLWKSLGETISEVTAAMKNVAAPETADDGIKAYEDRLRYMHDGPQKDRELRDLASLKAAVAADKRGAARAAAEAAVAAADDKAAIADDASGRTAARTNALADLGLARARNRSAQRLELLAQERQRTETEYELGLSGYEAYVQARQSLAVRELQAKLQQIDDEIAAEKRRDVGKDPAALSAQQAKLVALEGKRSAAAFDTARSLQADRSAQAKLEQDQLVANLMAYRDSWLAARDAIASAASAVEAAQSSNITASTALIRDPAAQATAQTAEQIRQLRVQAERQVHPWRLAVANTADPAQAAALQAQIDSLMSELETGVTLQNSALAETLKPGWQKMVEGWGDATQQMRESYDRFTTGIVQMGEDAFVRLATEGKLSAKELSSFIASEIARSLYRKSVGGQVGGFVDALLKGNLQSFLGGAGKVAGGGISLGGVRAAGSAGSGLYGLGSAKLGDSAGASLQAVSDSATQSAAALAAQSLAVQDSGVAQQLLTGVTRAAQSVEMTSAAEKAAADAIVVGGLKAVGEAAVETAIALKLAKSIVGGGSSIASAQGNVFGAGTGLHAFVNTVVNRPTTFAFASGIGLMGEDGPEAIMPLRRLPSGRLGVESTGAAAGPQISFTGGAIHIDARSDQAQVAQLVARAQQQERKRFYAELKSQGVMR
jgi:phage-related minor tail protein